MFTIVGGWTISAAMGHVQSAGAITVSRPLHRTSYVFYCYNNVYGRAFNWLRKGGVRSRKIERSGERKITNIFRKIIARGIGWLAYNR